MNEEDNKSSKSLLRAVFVPIITGLRNELKYIGQILVDIKNRKPPEIQKTEVTNHPDPIEEIDVKNFPEIQKSEITNFPVPQKEIEVKGILGLFSIFSKRITDAIKNHSVDVNKLIKTINSTVWKVKIENEKPFPSEIKISNPEDFKQEPPEFPKEVKILNSKPSEAIPVILTTKDRKRFYETMMQVIAGNDIDLSGVKESLQSLVDNNQSGELHDDYVAFDIAVTTAEQEVVLGATFTLFAIAVSTGKTVELKLNSASNDIITIEKQGTLAHDRFAVTSIFLRTISTTNQVTIFASRKV